MVGGGIAGVCCAREIASRRKVNVLLLSSSPALKEAKAVAKITQLIEEVEVYEKQFDGFTSDNPNVTSVRGEVKFIDVKRKEVKLLDGSIYLYWRICLCTGARPKVLRVKREREREGERKEEEGGMYYDS